VGITPFIKVIVNDSLNKFYFSDKFSMYINREDLESYLLYFENVINSISVCEFLHNKKSLESYLSYFLEIDDSFDLINFLNSNSIIDFEIVFLLDCLKSHLNHNLNAIEAEEAVLAGKEPSTDFVDYWSELISKEDLDILCKFSRNDEYETNQNGGSDNFKHVEDEVENYSNLLMFSLDFDKVLLEETDWVKNDVYELDFITNFIYYTKNWLYSFTENFYAYSYDITYYIYQNYIYDDAPHIKFKKYWFHTFKNEHHFILASLILDHLYALSIVVMPIFNEFYKHFYDSLEFGVFLENHPEYYFIFRDYLINYYHIYFTNFYLSLFLLNIIESFLTPVMMIPQFIFIFVAVLLLFMVYFNYYSNISSENNLIDHDYLSCNVTVEAEEEIGSMDDMLMASVILLYIFLWFFWIHSWSSVSVTPKLLMSVYLFPFIYCIILFIPSFLLYDYGMYFLTYLNGVGKSSIIIVELVFDYIAVSIFYLRLIVQNVRLAFMLFTFVELHELIIFYVVEKNIFPLNDTFINAWNNVKTYFNTSSWFLATSVPMSLLKWLYELFHTFFMVIFQFIAFFAMIFWLFLFLYTMFVSETQENFFSFKRLFRDSFFKEKISLKTTLLNLAAR
jgi:hypothetical protein